ncbi:MAG: hypothetical protein H7Z17_01040 [Fuerstia sp.]|nr:hypothetical protein [Fuerstiella sp.]
MSVATTRPAQSSSIRVPVLTPLYGAPHDPFCAQADGTYRCGSAAASEFSLDFAGAKAAHCSFIRQGGTFSVNRLDGRVWINDLPVNGVNRLREGDVISLGPVSYRLDFLDAPSLLPEPHVQPLGSFLSAANNAQRQSTDQTMISAPVPAASAALPVQDTSCQTALQKELEEHQRLLTLRQQQLEELTQVAREREREADARLAAIEERSSRMAAQWNDLVQKQEQLAAQERESFLRSQEADRRGQALANQQRHLAEVAEQNSRTLAAVEQAQRDLSQQEAALRPLLDLTQTAHAELHSRETQLQARETEFQQLCDGFAAREASLSQRNLELLKKTETLMQQEAALSDRAKALAEAEQRSAACAAVNADTLSMEQLAAIAAQKEAAVRERHLADQAQVELRRLQESIEARRLALQERESEIDARANEVCTRLQALKSLRRQQMAAPTIGAAPQTPFVEVVDIHALEQQAAAIRAEREELDRRAAEIAAAEARFAETRKSANSIVQAAESERTALQSANKDLLFERNAQAQLRQDLASRESGIAEREVLVARQLEDMRSRFAVLDLRAAEQKQHESELDHRAADVHRRIEQFKRDRQAHRETIRLERPIEGANVATAESAAELLAVRQQLDEARTALTATNAECASMLAEREALLSAVRELQKALQDARQDVEDAHRLKGESGMQEQRLQQAYQSIEEHCHNLQLSESKLLKVNEELESLRAELAKSVEERDELNTKLAESAQPGMAGSPVPRSGEVSALVESSEAISRELDQRADLLDRRDEELRERTRKIEQTEGDIENQRRLLLEARQQLELARAEIQVAMRKHTEPAQYVASPSPGSQFGSSFADELISDRRVNHDADLDRGPDGRESNDAAHIPATDLRSELAGLFGLRKPAAEGVTPPPLPAAAFVDVSEPSGANQSVVFHFGSDTPILAATEMKLAAAADPEPAREENSDDVVRDYMEQLLSRNRKSAGTALPGELKGADKKKDSAAASAAKPATGPAPKSPPKVKSYIEQYMAGNMGNLDNSEPLTMSEPETEVQSGVAHEEPRPVQPRPKMDLQKLKENMESFRTLSTQSVENALASHAIKVERLGFSGRAAFAALLILSTILLGVASFYGAIDSPMLMWVTLTSAIAILTELHRRYVAIAVHTRNPLSLLFPSRTPKAHVPQSVKPSAAVVVARSASDDFLSNDQSVKSSDMSDQPETQMAESSVS